MEESMMIDGVILGILSLWLIPLVSFVFYAVTEPVLGRRFLRNLIPWREVRVVTKLMVAQKASLILVILFILFVRFVGDFPGRQWVAFGLYAALVVLAWTMFVWERRVQLPEERKRRGR